LKFQAIAEKTTKIVGALFAAPCRLEPVFAKPSKVILAPVLSIYYAS